MDIMSILRHFAPLGERITEFRRRLHQMAELSFEEHQTAEYITTTLRSEGIECRPIVGTGVLAVVHGATPDEGRPVVLRADIDALPIEEQSGLPFASHHCGVMHACGHDLHAASLMGTLIGLKQLSAQFNGTIWGIFQPGEELAPGGASKIIEAGVFEHCIPRAIIGQHVEAGMDSTHFGFLAGKYMASADEIHIKVRGSGGHAAMRHKIADTVLAAAQLVVALQQIAGSTATPKVPTILSIGRVEALGATNVIPAEVALSGTMRTLDEQWRAEVKARIVVIADEVAAQSNTQIEVRFAPGYPSVYNNIKLTDVAITVAEQMFGREAIEQQQVKMTAEDFGFYGSLAPSLFYRFGAGAGSGMAHRADFSPEDTQLYRASALMAALAIETSCKVFEE